MSDVAARAAGMRLGVAVCRLAKRTAPIAVLMAIALAPAVNTPIASATGTAAVGAAGTYVDYLCTGPGEEPVGSGGIEAQLWGGAGFVSYETACERKKQALTMTLGPGPAPYANDEGGALVYSTPPGVTISAYSVSLSADAHGCAEMTGCPAGSGEVYLQHTGQVDPHYDVRDLGEGLVGLETVQASGMHGVSRVTMAVLCDAAAGACPAGNKVATLTVPAGTFTLLDATDPKVEDVSGPATGDGPLSGTLEWGFKAVDDASGVYAVVEKVDEKVVGHEVIGNSTGRCQEIEGGASRAFDAPQPCATEVTFRAALDTNDILDGTHEARVYVESAAGTEASVFEGQVVTEDGPTVEAAPAIAGTAKVGSVLSATDGELKARAGQTLAGESGQWESCTSASSCEPILGATGTSYVPTPENAGHELQYTVSATAKVTDGSSAEAAGITHTTKVSSAQTLPVAEAEGSSGSCAGPCTGPPGGGAGGNGGNGAGGGNGGAGSGAGAGVNVNLGTLGLGAPGGGQLGKPVPWRVSLHVRPRRVRRHTRVRLWGRVLTAPRPANGKLVFLQARSVRRVRRRVRGHARTVTKRGAWITFMELRAKPGGTFSASYRFHLGGRHVYEFRAVAPAEGQFRNRTGSSSTVTIHER